MQKKIFKLGLIAILSTLLLSGCFANIESNIKDTQYFGSAPDAANIFSRNGVPMEVDFTDFMTRVINTETGERYFYMVDDENLYLLTGNRENLRVVYADEGRIQFGFYTVAPRTADHPLADYLIFSLDNVIKKTKSTQVYLEFIDTYESVQISETLIDLTEGGYTGE